MKTRTAVHWIIIKITLFVLLAYRNHKIRIIMDS